MTQSTRRTPIMAANWKMHKTAAETKSFFTSFLPQVRELRDRQIVIAPPFTALESAAACLDTGYPVSLAAQNMHYENQGAYTGEISPIMLREFGVQWVILGHSERRHVFGEGDDLIGRKVEAALRASLRPILCIGETLPERETGRTFEILTHQLERGLAKTEASHAAGVTIAYEPVWAIGTGKTATPEQAQEAHTEARSWLAKYFGPGIAQEIRILYGGSVKSGNIGEFMALPDVDGVLVGGASLEAPSFAMIAAVQID